MEKKTFEKPYVEIHFFVDDIITTSGTNDSWTDDYIVPQE